MILDEHFSPTGIIDRLKREGFKDGASPLSVSTIYSAIDKGLIPNVMQDGLNADTTSIYDGALRFPTWFRIKFGIQDGDISRFKTNDAGQIILTKIGNGRQPVEEND